MRPDTLIREVSIRPYEDADADQVRRLFIEVNRLLAPADLRDVFEGYIARSLGEEIGRIRAYYEIDHDGGFWIAAKKHRVVGMFGLEPAMQDAMELRRMYVAPDARRAGVARSMLCFAEQECRRRGFRKLELSTSELQPAAIELYRRAGYRLLREGISRETSNKTLGGGIMRFWFEKEV